MVAGGGDEEEATSLPLAKLKARLYFPSFSFPTWNIQLLRLYAPVTGGMPAKKFMPCWDMPVKNLKRYVFGFRSNPAPKTPISPVERSEYFRYCVPNCSSAHL